MNDRRSILDRFRAPSKPEVPVDPTLEMRLAVRDQKARRLAGLVVPMVREMVQIRAASRVTFDREKAFTLIHAVRYYLPAELEREIHDPVILSELNKLMSAVAHLPDNLVDDSQSSAAYGAMCLVMLGFIQQAIAYFDLHVWVNTPEGEVDAMREILSGLFFKVPEARGGTPQLPAGTAPG